MLLKCSWGPISPVYSKSVSAASWLLSTRPHPLPLFSTSALVLTCSSSSLLYPKSFHLPQKWKFCHCLQILQVWNYIKLNKLTVCSFPLSYVIHLSLCPFFVYTIWLSLDYFEIKQKVKITFEIVVHTKHILCSQMWYHSSILALFCIRCCREERKRELAICIDIRLSPRLSCPWFHSPLSQWSIIQALDPVCLLWPLFSRAWLRVKQVRLDLFFRLDKCQKLCWKKK